MSEPVTASPPTTHRRWIFALAIVLPLLALLFLGQDDNWDLRNYHLYGPFAWLHGRLSLDIAPAQIQTWHNPLLDLPMYLMTVAHWPGFVVCLWLTLPSMLALYLLLRMHALLGIHPPKRARSAMLAMLALGGVGFFAVLGTCLNDAFVAAGVMAALYLVLREPAEADRTWIWCAAGAIAGAIAGLKLTSAPYCLGMAGAAMAWPGWRRTPLRLVALAVGGIAGVLLTWGWWGSTLWHLHGNPLFPYYNDVFRSPDATPLAHADIRFKPTSLLDGLLVPLHLLVTSHRYSEMKLRDPRLLLGVLAWAWLGWRAFRAGGVDPARAARLRAIAGFFFVALPAWSLQYGIYRYAIPLEMLGCLGFVLALEALPARRLDVATLIACLAAIAMTFPASWGRSHFQRSYVDVHLPALPQGSMIVVAGWSPLAYVATALPDDVPVIAVYNTLVVRGDCGGTATAARQRIARHGGTFWLLRDGDPTDDDGQRIAASDYGLVVAGTCEPVETNLGTVRLCPLRKDPPPPVCAKVAPAPGR